MLFVETCCVPVAVAVCCLQFAVCGLLRVGCFSFVASCLLTFVVRCSLCVACCVQPVVRSFLFVVCCMVLAVCLLRNSCW